MAPFSDKGHFADLSIEHVEVFLSGDRIWSEFEQDGNATAFGARWAAFSRASVFPTLVLGLDGGRDDPREAAFLNNLEAAMVAKLAAAPERMVIPLGVMVLVKEVR